jgi:VanZ family protein
MQIIYRLAAWLIAFTIIVLSLVPPSARPVTDVSHGLEHLAIFLVCGLAFGAGYPDRALRLIVGLIGFSAVVEIVQIWVPGRHARLSDFFVDAAAVSIGAGFGCLIERKRRLQLSASSSSPTQG